MHKFVSEFNFPTNYRVRAELETLLNDFLARGGRITRVKDPTLEALEVARKKRYGENKNRTGHWKQWKTKGPRGGTNASR